MRSTHARRRIAAILSTAVVAALGIPLIGVGAAQAVSESVVISQVYGGGGNSGAPYTHDFVELYNRGSSPASLSGWSVQYASATGTGNFGSTATQLTELPSVTLAPGQYFLVQEAGGTTGLVLPSPDLIDPSPISMSATAGKVALVSSATSLGCNGGSTPCSAEQFAQIVDLVGFGSANFFEGPAAAPTLTNTTAALRNGNGAQDTDNNAADFVAGAPNPRNSSTGNPPGVSLAVGDVSLNEGNTGTTEFTLTVALSAPAGAGGVTFDIATADDTATVADSDYVSASLTGQTIPEGSSSYSFSVHVNGDTAPETDETFFVNVTNVTGAAVADGQGVGAIINDDIVDVCSLAYTPIYEIQGSGTTAAITGTVTTEGVVVGDYEGPSPALRGFYLQDEIGDGSAATSDGIFVFNGNNNSVAIGDVVRVTGTVAEYQDQTQISANPSFTLVCDTSTVEPVDVTFPRTETGDLEPYEGMLVRLPDTMYVTEHFQLGRFGQVVVSSGGRLQQPTNVVAPGAAANELQAENNMNRIIIDDALNNQNPDPIVFGRDGLPLSASNTLRGGDTAIGITGVMTYTWAGNAASGNAYRVRPINALDGYVNFEAVNQRPLVAPEVGGSLQVAALNLLNYFNTFDGLPDNVNNCALGVGGASTDCRGADNQTEFDRQWAKTVEAINGMGAEVVGIVEIENDGYAAESAIAHLVWRLNEDLGEEAWAFIDADARTGQLNALGTDAIKVGMLYQPAKVTPVGTTAALNSVEFVNGGDSEPRNRPALAQAFRDHETGGVFTAVVNHLKSKGSACDAPEGEVDDAGDGQGNCNEVRTYAAGLLADWLDSDPTGTGDFDTLILGDLNSYAMEDPITVLKDAGYTNLIESLVGPGAYSYVFDGQWGYLDHALGSGSIVDQVTDVAEWHINADEPSVLDYNTDFKSPGQILSLYAPDQFRVSDHDPVVVGLDLDDDSIRFVTGGGWFTSPEGSLLSYPDWGGKATFGLSAKYEPGMTYPTGSFGLNLVGAPFKVSATAVDWLVVSGHTARLAGPATVNGMGVYSYDVTLTDGGKKNDMISVVIRDAAGVVVYDSDGSQAVKGQVTIHK